jgi:hypothetical protein
VESAKTPAGGRDSGDPAGVAEEAPGPPAESEVPGTEINSLDLTKTNKTVGNLDFHRDCLQPGTTIIVVSFLELFTYILV